MREAPALRWNYSTADYRNNTTPAVSMTHTDLVVGLDSFCNTLFYSSFSFYIVSRRPSAVVDDVAAFSCC